MSTEPYPEVTGDESGLVPPQAGRSPEWPKKIRTLTASELDRLTIDSTGRFYWDGRLVNYEPPKSGESDLRAPDAADRSAMDIIDRAVYELGEHKTPEPIEGAELPKPGTVAHREREDMRAVDYDHVRPTDNVAAPAAARVRSIRANDRVRLSLSRWQSLGAIIVVLGIAIGASGLAAYGWVVAHDWGCRIGVVKSYCPSSPANPATRPPRSDIPA